jgi:hypothetical protein
VLVNATVLRPNGQTDKVQIPTERRTLTVELWEDAMPHPVTPPPGSSKNYRDLEKSYVRTLKMHPAPRLHSVFLLNTLYSSVTVPVLNVLMTKCQRRKRERVLVRY